MRSAQGSLRSTPHGAEHVPGWERPPLFRLRRTALAVVGALLSINAWTGAPLFAIWVGSRFEGWVGGSATGGGTSMRAVFVLIAVLALLELVLTVALTRVSAAYDELN